MPRCSEIRLGGIGLDCDDPVQLGDFWAALLGGEVIYASESLAVVKLGDLFLNAYRVEGPQAANLARRTDTQAGPHRPRC